jgi:hypothetical protein
MTIKDLIEVLPNLLCYFIPGAIAIKLYDILLLKKHSLESFSFWSVVWSFIIKLAADALWKSPQNPIGNIAIAVIVPIAIYFVARCNPFGIDSFFGATPPTNIWLEMLDFDDNNYIVIHLSNGSIYNGTIYSADNDWVILKDYCSGGETKKFDVDDHQILCIPTSKIEYFEWAYEKDSEKIKEFYPQE